MTASAELTEIIVATGASSGIGAATARKLAMCGFHVLAGVRRKRDAEAIKGPGIEPMVLDITKADHIEALSVRVNERPPNQRLRAVVNNAGIALNVPVEVYAIDEWRRLFEVNFFGHVAVTQALLPALIQSKGRVINISSVGGKAAMATYGPYAATKFGIEALSDSLRREIASLGVDVFVIEPGAIRTGMGDRAIATAHEAEASMTREQGLRYGGLIHAITEQTAHFMKSALPAEAAAKVIAKAVTARKPRTRYTVGRDAALLSMLARILPDRILDRVLAAALRPYFPTT